MRLRVRLLRKFADRLNDVDLSKFRVGDCVELAPREARMLLAEGWAELCERERASEDARND